MPDISFRFSSLDRSVSCLGSTVWLVRSELIYVARQKSVTRQKRNYGTYQVSGDIPGVRYQESALADCLYSPVLSCTLCQRLLQTFHKGTKTRTKNPAKHLSVLLGVARNSPSGTPSKIRTCDTALRKRVLYPAELWGRVSLSLPIRADAGHPGLIQ